MHTKEQHKQLMNACEIPNSYNVLKALIIEIEDALAKADDINFDKNIKAFHLQDTKGEINNEI